ncbi:MAG: ABC transporter permease [Dehalococcoidales bacterium]|jgi:putative ABC transport system permease protein
MKKALKWFDPVKTAWGGVVTHKLRSFLTMLGIVIGVGAVITLMSVGKGSTAEILSNIQNMGANLMTIRGGATFSSGGVRGAMGGSNTLTMEDATAIQDQVANVAAVAPSSSSNLQLVAGSENANSQVTGVTSSYLVVNNLAVAGGSFFTDAEYQRGAKVAVLGAGVATTLYPDTSPIGQKLRMGNLIVTVIGVLESKEGTMSSYDDSVLIPLTTLHQAVAETKTTQGETTVSSISLTVTDESKTDQVKTDITTLLRSRHRLLASANDDFSITSMSDIVATLSETSSTMTLLLGAIAGISLLVGGIGVMNIMLVSVLERTREIGIRKALGARQRDIWSQFLIEAALLTLAGGIIGIIGGWGTSWILNQTGVVTTLVTSDIVVLAVSVSVAIGLFFGFYPAWNASRLNPIEALRSE